MDDKQVKGPTRELTWQASHKLAQIQSCLGVQDVARKVCTCSQTPGVWAGAVMNIIQRLGVCTLISEEKWAPLKSLLNKWWKLLKACGTELAHKELLLDQGFLVYATRTYPTMVPYLKGFHLTIETWSGGRDKEGYKVKQSRSASVVESKTDEATPALSGHKSGSQQQVHAPSSGLTTIVPCLVSDVGALQAPTDFDLPPLCVV